MTPEELEAIEKGYNENLGKHEEYRVAGLDHLPDLIAEIRMCWAKIDKQDDQLEVCRSDAWDRDTRD